MNRSVRSRSNCLLVHSSNLADTLKVCSSQALDSDKEDCRKYDLYDGQRGGNKGFITAEERCQPKGEHLEKASKQQAQTYFAQQ